MASVRGGLLALLLGCFGGMVALAQAPAPEIAPEAMESLNKQVGWDDSLPGEKNPTGLRMQFVKVECSSAPPAKGAGHLLRYRLLVPGAPEDRTYALASWRIGSEAQIAYVQVYVNARGLAMAHKPRPKQEHEVAVDAADEIELAFQAAAGEPVRFALVSQDGKLIVPGTVVPYPVENQSGNCRLEARLAMPDAEAVLIYADGLEPDADVPFQAVSEGEAHSGSFHANARGHAATVDLPYVTQKAAGILKVSVTAKGCSVAVEIPWGKGSYRPL